jgi:tRNA(Ile)-lysidine synthase
MILLNKKFIPDGPFYVGVSGGIDSIACLHLLQRMLGNRVKACHYNHNLRPQNNIMQQSVERFCDDLNIQLIVATRPSQDILGNVEHNLRNDRLDFFRSLDHDIVLCHHLNDAVESYIMNMLRGCPEYVPIPTITNLEDSSHSIHHPFLGSSKNDIINYATNQKLIDYVVEDETNADNKYRRNWVRNEVAPMFKEYGLEKIVKKKFYS